MFGLMLYGGEALTAGQYAVRARAWERLGLRVARPGASIVAYETLAMAGEEACSWWRDSVFRFLETFAG